MVGASSYHLGQGIVQSGPLLAFMNEVLLEHSTLICPCMMYGCFHAVMAGLSSSGRYHMACKAENIY